MQRREPNTMKSLSWQRWQRPVHRGVGLKISRDGSSITQKERLRTCVQMQESWLVWSEKMKKLCSACFCVLNEMRLLVEYEEGRKEVWNRLHAAWLSSFSPPFAMQWKIPYSSIFWILLTAIYPFLKKSLPDFYLRKTGLSRKSLHKLKDWPMDTILRDVSRTVSLLLFSTAPHPPYF